MQSSDFVTVNFLLSKITVTTGDQDLRTGFTRGWYVFMIQEALSELAFDTYFNIETCDIYDWNEDGDFRVDLPKGCFSVKELYLWNGDRETIEDSIRVNFKVRFNNAGHTSGYTAEVKDGGANCDPMYPRISRIPSTLVYANIQQGTIMLSESSDGWDNLRVVFYGVPYDVGEVPVIPVYLSKAVCDYVVEQYFRAKKAKDPRQRPNWMDAFAILHGNGGRGNAQVNRGSWGEARIRVQSISDWELKSLREYWGRSNYI